MRHVVGKALAAALVLLVSAPSTALAQVTRQDLDEAQAKVREISRRLEGRLTELDRSIGLQSSYENRIQAIQRQLQDRQREMVLVEYLAKERARAVYMTAGASRFQTVLGSARLSELGARDGYLDSLAAQERDVVNELLFLQNDSVRLQGELEQLLANQQIDVERLKESSSDVYSELAIANAEYQKVFQQWQKQEEERRRREEEARRRAEEARRNRSDSGHISPSGRTCPVAGAHSFRDSWLEPRPGGRKHHGVDMIAATGTPLVAIESGHIWSMSWHYLGGNGIYVRGNSGDIYYYAHLHSFASGMSQGVRVDRGQVIGYVGDTGNATGTPHLHLGYQPGGGPLTNPYQLMVKLCR